MPRRSKCTHTPACDGQDPLDLDLLRTVTMRVAGGAYTLTTWATNRRDGRGQTVIRYRLADPEGAAVFHGEDFAGSPLQSDDSDATLRALLGFLTLRKGDTDADYFDRYTDRQLDFRDGGDCEALSLWASDDGPDFDEE